MLAPHPWQLLTCTFTGGRVHGVQRHRTSGPLRHRIDKQRNRTVQVEIWRAFSPSDCKDTIPLGNRSVRTNTIWNWRIDPRQEGEKQKVGWQVLIINRALCSNNKWGWFSHWIEWNSTNNIANHQMNKQAAKSDPRTFISLNHISQPTIDLDFFVLANNRYPTFIKQINKQIRLGWGHYIQRAEGSKSRVNDRCRRVFSWICKQRLRNRTHGSLYDLDGERWKNLLNWGEWEKTQLLVELYPSMDWASTNGAQLKILPTLTACLSQERKKFMLRVCINVWP